MIWYLLLTLCIFLGLLVPSHALSSCTSIIRLRTECRQNLIYNGASFSTCANQSNLIFPSIFTADTSSPNVNMQISAYTCVNDANCVFSSDTSYSTSQLASTSIYPTNFYSVPSSLGVQLNLLSQPSPQYSIIVSYTPIAVNESSLFNSSVVSNHTSALDTQDVVIQILLNNSVVYPLFLDIGDSNFTMTPFDVNMTILNGPNNTIVTWDNIVSNLTMLPKQLTSGSNKICLHSNAACDGLAFPYQTLATLNPDAYGYFVNMNYQLETPTTSFVVPNNRRLLLSYQGNIATSTYNFPIYASWFGYTPIPPPSSSSSPVLSTGAIVGIVVAGVVVLTAGIVAGLYSAGIIGGSAAAATAGGSTSLFSTLSSCFTRSKNTVNKGKKVNKTRAQSLQRISKIRAEAEKFRRAAN